MRFWLFLMLAAALTVAAALGLGALSIKMLATPPPARFVTPFFEITLAPDWSCEQDGTEYVCLPKGRRPAPAIMVIAMKQRSATDDLSAYAEHLRKPQHQVTRDGQAFTSKVRYVRLRWINGHQWVDGLHDESELPKYWTHYLGATTSHLGVLITFNASHDAYAVYKPQFESMIASLDIYQQ